MMTLIEEKKIRLETRGLRQQMSRVTRWWTMQKEKNARLTDKLKEAEQEVSQLKKRVFDLKKDNRNLKEKLEAMTCRKDTLVGMIFKPNAMGNKESHGTTNRKRGAQTGHKGYSRKKPETIDQEKEAYLTNCPACQTELKPTNTYHERIVTEIPEVKPLTTKYHIQRQWCPQCRKEVNAVPKGALPGVRFGINLLSWILFQKYRLRVPLAKTKEAAKELYGLELSQGGIQKTLYQLKHKFGSKYQEILKEIRMSPVKHADETGWRIQGMNSWVWLFATPKAALYTIEQTRGKGVPQRIFGNNPQGVLVRDDYGAYESLVMAQQSCWAHLLRKSREASIRPDASQESKTLYQELKQMFLELKTITEKPFDKKERTQHYQYYLGKIETIANTNYNQKDAKEIQTRIQNQHKNLITALLHENVPLTNNHAERQVRPMVVLRKISGGSQSDKGAQTQAVNMSITQTILLEGKSFFQGVKELLTLENQRFVLEKGE